MAEDIAIPTSPCDILIGLRIAFYILSRWLSLIDDLAEITVSTGKDDLKAIKLEHRPPHFKYIYFFTTERIVDFVLEGFATDGRLAI